MRHASVKERILREARADHIPSGAKGLWFVVKFAVADSLHVIRDNFLGRGPDKQHRAVVIPRGHYTQLWRLTTATMHQKPPGDIVMQDTPDELNQHLDFMLRAHGHVLITGLGLGCVARGCLANPLVKSVTVVEKDESVIALAWPFIWKHYPGRINLIHADALQWVKTACLIGFDCAWHDLWSDEEADEPHLQLLHSNLICALVDHVKFQGAWNLPRWFRHKMEGVVI